MRNDVTPDTYLMVIYKNIPNVHAPKIIGRRDRTSISSLLLFTFEIIIYKPYNILYGRYGGERFAQVA